MRQCDIEALDAATQTYDFRALAQAAAPLLRARDPRLDHVPAASIAARVHRVIRAGLDSVFGEAEPEPTE